jgi:serine phosphatase RsbU (regulator of sigma subunit)
MRTGDVLVLFTDGTLEVVGGHGATDDEQVRALLAPLAGRTAEDVARALDDVLVPAPSASPMRDDAAFVVVAVR